MRAENPLNNYSVGNNTSTCKMYFTLYLFPLINSSNIHCRGYMLTQNDIISGEGNLNPVIVCPSGLKVLLIRPERNENFWYQSFHKTMYLKWKPTIDDLYAKTELRSMHYVYMDKKYWFRIGRHLYNFSADETELTLANFINYISEIFLSKACIA